MRKFTLLMAFVFCTAMITTAQNNASSNQKADPLAFSQGESGNIVHPSTFGKGVGDVMSQLTTAPIHAWGVGFDGQYLYFTDPFGSDGTTIHQYDLSGNPTGYTINGDFGGPSWIGDMASDGTLLYCCNVGGDNAINVFDIATGALVNTLTGDWAYTSQRGLAYDAIHNEFYIGGWNSNKIWRVDATGATISEFDFSSISGLAWNPTGGPSGAGSLWVVANTTDDLVTELDPNNGWATLQTFNIPNGSQYSGAGLEMNSDGNLWVVNQSDEVVYLVDSGDTSPNPASVPLSNWALVFSMILISGFVIIRYTKFFG